MPAEAQTGNPRGVLRESPRIIENPNLGTAMIRPEQNEFLRLARHATLVPVSKSISADLQTPVSAFLSLAAGEPHAFLLESIEGGEKIGRYTFLGARPSVILSSSGEEVRIEYPGQRRKPEV